MNDKNQLKENSTTEHSESFPAFNVRRKLIKGTAIAVPVVMTLRSGAALAATSSQCIVKDQANAQTLLDNGNLPQFRPDSTLSEETFYREEVTRSRLTRIIRDPTDTFWFIDKNSNGNPRRRTIYNYDTSPSPVNEWLDTRANQKQYLAQGGVDINVYDTETTGPGNGGSVVITGEHFTEGIRNHVFENDQVRIRHGIIMTTASGGIIMDEFFGRPRIGRTMSSGTLTSMHITTSCMTSLA